ncbi:MAG TPA: DinB family protein, partial [Cytophagaceae bacterium]
MYTIEDYIDRFRAIRSKTLQICGPLKPEDFVVQPMVDVSPPKWHLGHTTWFFETFILLPLCNEYKIYNEDFAFVFNSYYETLGKRVLRADRGNLSRPTVDQVFEYRKYVDEKMLSFLSTDITSNDVLPLLEIGLQHEQQHQELLVTDIKYILGNNPLFPVYSSLNLEIKEDINTDVRELEVPEGLYEIGFTGEGFCFDNELGRHKVYLHGFTFEDRLITNFEYRAFIEAGGYEDFRHWLQEGWEYV